MLKEIIELDKLLEPYKYSSVPRSIINRKLIPVNNLEPNDEGIEEMNTIMHKVKELIDKGIYKLLKRTKSGGIKTDKLHFEPLCADVDTFGCGVELTLITYGQRCYRFQLRSKDNSNTDETESLLGNECYMKLRKEFLKDGIDLDMYKVSKSVGYDYKERTPKYMIDLVNGETDTVYKHINHLDFHSSFAGGLKRMYPEFARTVDRLYKNRKKKPENKQILNKSIGYLGSSHLGYSLAKLRYDAVDDNNYRLRVVYNELIRNGRIPLAFNTDGIWYSGNPFTDSEFYGKGCGQFENDYVDCTIRFKSKGCYEFIDNEGKYHPVARGRFVMEATKPRSEWTWGDIYKTGVIVNMYNFDRNTWTITGVINMEV